MPKKTIKKRGANLPSELRAPLQVESLGLWLGSLTREEISKQISGQAEKRFVALMKHFNISLRSPDKWKYLCFCLAVEFGLMEATFKRPKKPHASRVWSEKESLLVERIDRKIAERRQRGLSISIRNIARYLTAADPKFKHLTVKSLANRYGEAKRRRTQGSLASLLEAPSKSREKTRNKRTFLGQVFVSLTSKRFAEFTLHLHVVCVHSWRFDSMVAGTPVQVRLQDDELSALDHYRREWLDEYLHDLAAPQRHVKEVTAWQRISSDPFERANAELWSPASAPEAWANFRDLNLMER